MIRRRIPQQGDVYWIGPNLTAAREMKNHHRYVVITPRELNALGVSITVPITSRGAFARDTGLFVLVTGNDTAGAAVCNQARSFDIEARERAGSARYVETLDAVTTDEIISRVISVIDPAP